MEKKLEVKNLVISFRTQAGKVQAVRDISFDLYIYREGYCQWNAMYLILLKSV